MSVPNIDTSDLDEFLSEVDEVSRLINGLSQNTITPDYIDTKQNLKQLKLKEKENAGKKRQPDAIKASPVDQASGGT